MAQKAHKSLPRIRNSMADYFINWPVR